MKKMKEMKSDNIDKAKFFCKDGKQPKCAAGKKLVWRMGGEQKQKKKFDPKKGGCLDMQKPLCADNAKPTCLKGEDATTKRCTDKQPRLCTGGTEPLCSDGKPAMRPKGDATKQVKLVCPTGEASCQAGGVASCSDAATPTATQFECNAAWLCSDKTREMCSDGTFPKLVAKKDKKKQGWNKPVRKPKLSKDDFKNEDLDDTQK